MNSLKSPEEIARVNELTVGQVVARFKKEYLEMKAEIALLKEALSGRTVSCSNCNEMAKRCEEKDERIQILRDEMRGDELYNKYKSLLSVTKKMKEVLESIHKISSFSPSQEDIHDLSKGALKLYEALNERGEK